MNEPAVTTPATRDRDPGPGGPTQAIYLIAGIWFLFLALPSVPGEASPVVYDFLRGLALGLALLALGHIRWSRFHGLFGIG